MPNLFQRAMRRLAPSNADLESAELQQSVRDEGAVAIGDCADREMVRLTGTISCVTVHPRGGHPALEVDLRDGSGTVRLVWLGRRQIPGIDAGRRLRVAGRICCRDGDRVIFNPRYELLSAQAAS